MKKAWTRGRTGGNRELKMKDFIEFFQTIGERLRSRIFGPFILSFIFWNWKPLLLICSSKRPIEEVIEAISDQGYFTLENVLIIPLGISIAYSIVIPFLSLGLGLLVVWPQGKSIESNYILKGKRRKEDVKIAKLDYEYENAKAGKLELQELNNKVNSLTKEKETHILEIDSLSLQIESLKQENLNQSIEFQKDLDIRQDNLINRMSERYSKDLNLTKGFLLEELNKELQKGNFLLEGLGTAKLNFLKDEKLIVFYNQNGIDLGYAFTDEGRSAYINFLKRT